MIGSKQEPTAGGRPGEGLRVGGQERPAFLWQARLLSEEWDCPWSVEAGRHHFDVVEGLADPGAGLVEACLGGLG